MNRRTIDGTAGQRGIALIAVLWALVLLALIAATVMSEGRSVSRLARNLTEAARAEALADGGVHRAMAALAVSTDAGGWRTDGTVYAWRRADGEIRVRIEDEGGKVDINRASGPLLRSLLLGAGLETGEADALADAIQDYRDGDGRKRPLGAEDAEYEAAGLSYGAKDAPFDTPEELQQVLGMRRETYAGIAGLVTVYSRARRPDLKAASARLRAALGQDEATAPPAEEAVPLRHAGGPPVEVLRLGPTAYRSRARTYTIHAEARTPSGGLYARRAVVQMIARGAVPYRILAWGRGDSRLFTP